MQVVVWHDVTMLTVHAPDDLPVDGMSVGTVAARLGVSTATLRSWGTRYGLTPALHSPGGHRRYSTSDVARLIRMQSLVSDGVTPAAAAKMVSDSKPASRPDHTALAGSLPAGTPDVSASADALDVSASADAPDVSASADAPDVSASDGSATNHAGSNGPARPADLAGRARAGERSRPGGPGGRVLAVPGGSAAARGLARAAGRLDTAAMSQIITRHLEEDGASVTWDELLRPVLVSAGLAWAKTGSGIEIEHVLSEAIIEALRIYRERRPVALPGPPVLLACSATELHVLPLHIMASALAEWRVPTLLLGARVPGAALAAAARRTRARAVFLWRQQPTDADAESAALAPMRPAVLAVVGGPGWDAVPLPASVRRVPDLETAVAVLRAAALR